MYKRIVARKVRTTFAALSVGDRSLMVATLAPSFTYRFAGTNALSGIRTSRDEIERWWERVFDLFPGVRFDVRRVVVAGPPWATEIATHVVLSAPRQDGPDYRNEFVQLMHLRWGKATNIMTLEDTRRCDEELLRMAASGNDLAEAAPIGGPATLPA